MNSLPVGQPQCLFKLSVRLQGGPNGPLTPSPRAAQNSHRSGSSEGRPPSPDTGPPVRSSHPSDDCRGASGFRGRKRRALCDAGTPFHTTTRNVLRRSGLGRLVRWLDPSPEADAATAPRQARRGRHHSHRTPGVRDRPTRRTHRRSAARPVGHTRRHGVGRVSGKTFATGVSGHLHVQHRPP